MSQLKPKQIAKFLSTFVGLVNLSVTNASSLNITAALTTALATAGDGGVAVPLQVGSAIQQGVIVSGNNQGDVWETGSKDAPVIGGNQVYARITHAAGVYTASFYTNVGGVETAAVINGNFDIAIPYVFSFETLPRDALITWNSLSPGDAQGAGGTLYVEALTVTAPNTITNLTRAPINPATAVLTVNGQSLFAGTHFTITGQAITFSGPQLTAIGFSIATTDQCFMEYWA